MKSTIFLINIRSVDYQIEMSIDHSLKHLSSLTINLSLGYKCYDWALTQAYDFFLEQIRICEPTCGSLN